MLPLCFSILIATAVEASLHVEWSTTCLKAVIIVMILSWMLATRSMSTIEDTSIISDVLSYEQVPKEGSNLPQHDASRVCNRKDR